MLENLTQGLSLKQMGTRFLNVNLRNFFINLPVEVGSLLLNVKLKEYRTPEMYVLILDTMNSRAFQKQIAWYLVCLLMYSDFPSIQGMFS